MTSAVQKNSSGTTLISATYTYDVFGNRIASSVTQSGTTTVTHYAYLNGQLWADLTSSNALQTRYLSGNGSDHWFARIDSTGTYWLLPDHLGSIRDVMNSSGTVIDHINYDAFGAITSETSSSNGGRLKYAGYEWESALSVYHAGARYYDPATHRWMKEDPIGFDGGDSNLDRYVGNGPTDGTDPSGQFLITKDHADAAYWVDKLHAAGIRIVTAHTFSDGTRWWLSVPPAYKDEVRNVRQFGGWWDEKMQEAISSRSLHVTVGQGAKDIEWNEGRALSERDQEEIDRAFGGSQYASTSHNGPSDLWNTVKATAAVGAVAAVPLYHWLFVRKPPEGEPNYLQGPAPSGEEWVEWTKKQGYRDYHEAPPPYVLAMSQLARTDTPPACSLHLAGIQALNPATPLNNIGDEVIATLSHPERLNDPRVRRSSEANLFLNSAALVGIGSLVKGETGPRIALEADGEWSAGAARLSLESRVSAPIADPIVPNEMNVGGAGRLIPDELSLAGRLPRSVMAAEFRDVVGAESAKLAANPRLAQTVLSPAEYAVGQSSASVARMQYGNALERMVGNTIRDDPFSRLLFDRLGGPNNPDFIGRGFNFDITTPGQISAHAGRTYGPSLIYGTYERPLGFTVFP